MEPPILITGAHRSGTTWVGRTLASHVDVGYIDEPLNIHPGGPATRFYEHVRENHDTVAAGYLLDAFAAVAPRRPLVKDPMALVSAEWFATRFEARVVVLVRHPAAFASSLKLLGWLHPWAHFLEQPSLMDGPLRPFAAAIEELASTTPSVIEDAALLWGVLASIVREYQARHSDWTFVRHEDLSRQPMAGFEALCRRVGLEFSEACRAAVRAHSLAADPDDDPTRRGDVYGIERHSAANVFRWRSRLTAAELSCLRDRVRGFEHFYPEPEWAF
jgi:hypothetical protein